MDFAAALKRICSDKGTSPTALLQELGISTSKVSLWNSGSLPKADMIQRLADALHVQPYEFFMDERPVAPIADSVTIITEDEE